MISTPKKRLKGCDCFGMEYKDNGVSFVLSKMEQYGLKPIHTTKVLSMDSWIGVVNQEVSRFHKQESKGSVDESIIKFTHNKSSIKVEFEGLYGFYFKKTQYWQSIQHSYAEMKMYCLNDEELEPYRIYEGDWIVDNNYYDIFLGNRLYQIGKESEGALLPAGKLRFDGNFGFVNLNYWVRQGLFSEYEFKQFHNLRNNPETEELAGQLLIGFVKNVLTQEAYL